jgi:hypothetical protein
MYIIRKISPWQTFFQEEEFFTIGNPAVFVGVSEAEVLATKIELELDAIMVNPIPNFYEYWDVESSKELIRLNNFLVENYDFSILNTNKKSLEDILERDEIIHGICFDRRFSEADMLKIQVFVGRYYYKIQKIEEVGKYILVADVYSQGNFLEDSEFKLYDTEAEAKVALQQYPADSLEIQEIES